MGLLLGFVPRRVRLPIVYVHINISSLLWFEFQPIRFFFFTCCHPPSLLPTPQTLVPDSATSAMSTPCSCAMKPRTENIAKPDTKLVPLLRPPSSRQSLCHTWRSLVDTPPLQFTHTPSAATTTVSPPPPPPPARPPPRRSSPVAVVSVIVVAPQ